MSFLFLTFSECRENINFDFEYDSLCQNYSILRQVYHTSRRSNFFFRDLSGTLRIRFEAEEDHAL